VSLHDILDWRRRTEALIRLVRKRIPDVVYMCDDSNDDDEDDDEDIDATNTPATAPATAPDWSSSSAK
jgi:hypothetical protein